MRKLLGFILVCVMITTIFTGCAFLDKFGDNSLNDDELNPASSVTMNENEANGLKDKSPVQLYFINEQGNKLSAETRYISNTDTSEGNEHLATVIVKELIAGPAKGSLLMASIPQGTALKSDVTIKDGTATVNLSKEFVDKHPGGKKSEQLTLYSVVNTLTEIKDIKSVQFKIDGKVRKDFKGSYQIDVAYPRSAYLITDTPTENSVDSAKSNISQPSKQENITQPSKQENITQPSKQENITQPSKQENITQPSKQENITQPSKQEEKTQPAKDDSSKDKKTNSDLGSDDENVETNADLLE